MCLTCPEELDRLEARYAILKEEHARIEQICDNIYVSLEDKDNEISMLMEVLASHNITILDDVDEGITWYEGE